jgi:hypothetical protein
MEYVTRHDRDKNIIYHKRFPFYVTITYTLHNTVNAINTRTPVEKSFDIVYYNSIQDWNPYNVHTPLSSHPKE